MSNRFEANYTTEPSYDLLDALRLSLLFHGGGEWDEKCNEEWLRITGTTQATTKVLCDHLRAALAIAESATKEPRWLMPGPIAARPPRPAMTRAELVELRSQALDGLAFRIDIFEHLASDCIATLDALDAMQAELDAASARVGELEKALSGIKWRSADRDNMEFSATITYSQMDAIRAALRPTQEGPRDG